MTWPWIEPAWAAAAKVHNRASVNGVRILASPSGGVPAALFSGVIDRCAGALEVPLASWPGFPGAKPSDQKAKSPSQLARALRVSAQARSAVGRQPRHGLAQHQRVDVVRALVRVHGLEVA